MAKRDILKEAIADAKAVKEVAIANAKAALEEAFTPKLKSMLAAKIAEMDENNDAPIKEYDHDFMEFCKQNPEDPQCPGSPWNEGKENDGEEIVDEEVNLDEVLAELEQETLTEEEDVEKEDEEDETEDEEEGVELEDMTDEELKTFIEDVIADMVAAGELEAGGSTETEDDEEIDIEIEDDEVETEETEDDEEIDIEIEDDEAPVLESNKFRNKTTRVTTESKKYRRAIRKSKDELREAYATIKSLRYSLNEVNLLNAKLLYTNKIFKAKSLTENEKRKVLRAFDKATTVKETKLIFSTLSEGLNNKKKQIRESLGSASKATGNFTKKKKPIIEANPMVERFQKLAGLK
jgi:hypothetical protein